ncbi:MAG: hypothetical protein Aurels2KO_47990 [Aureliella sp.]
MPRVSIGLPVYNGENFVADAIESVLAQSFTDWELVISDNASSDRTAELCRSYAARDERIRFEAASENRGAAWNFNRVFQLASAPFFRWLSHDDYLAPDCIQLSLHALESDSRAVLCSTSTGVINAHGQQVLDNTPAASDLQFQELSEQGEAKRISMSQAASPSTRYAGILFYSRRCYEVYGLIRRETMIRTQLHPSYCGGEKVWLAEVALLGRIIELPETLFYCRWHDARFTANSSTVEQAEHMSPGRSRRFALPHQYRSALGYLQLVFTKPLTPGTRLSCFTVWLRFILQVQKWLTLFRQTFSGTATNVRISRATRLGEQIVPQSSRNYGRETE